MVVSTLKNICAPNCAQWHLCPYRRDVTCPYELNVRRIQVRRLQSQHLHYEFLEQESQPSRRTHDGNTMLTIGPLWNKRLALAVGVWVATMKRLGKIQVLKIVGPQINKIFHWQSFFHVQLCSNWD